MKVAILAEELAFGGISRYCLALVQGLRKHSGIELHLLALHSPGEDWLLGQADDLGVHVQVLVSQPVRSLRKILSGRGIDVVHSQGYRSNAISRLALYRAGLPTKSVCTVHGAYYFAAAPWRSRCYYALDYSTMFRSNRVVAVSAATACQISRWAGEHRVTVIHNGTCIPPSLDERDRFLSRESLGIPGQAKVICFVGRLEPQKGIDALIAIMADVLAVSRDLVFLIVGDGGLRSKVESCSQEFGERVIMVGTQRDVNPYYMASDLLLLPSRSEGLPMALIEAFARGLPAVASNVGGVPEVLVDGRNGFLCDRDDAGMMGRRLLLLARDDALRAKMGADARHTAIARFSGSGMVEATYRMYLALMS